MEELLGLESIICDVIEEDVPEYNQVKDDDSIAVKNAKLAAQAKAKAAGQSQNLRHRGIIMPKAQATAAGRMVEAFYGRTLRKNINRGCFEACEIILIGKSCIF